MAVLPPALLLAAPPVVAPPPVFAPPPVVAPPEIVPDVVDEAAAVLPVPLTRAAMAVMPTLGIVEPATPPLVKPPMLPPG